MSHADSTDFTPATVDEQIERHLTGLQSTPDEQAAQRALHAFQRIYQRKSAEHVPSLERVWQRVLAAGTQESTMSSPLVSAPATRDEQEETQQGGSMSLANSPMQSKNRTRTRRTRTLFAQLAAVLCLVLLVGSFLLVTALSHPGQPTLLNITGGSGLYAYLNRAIYRLDSQTHTILWKHAFASGETVEGGTIFSNNSEQPSVVHGIVYLETRENTQNGRQYLYALNSANGSVLWRQPSARAFVNGRAVYTLVESTTSNVSTLTARDPQTGRQLWQRQYPIAGAAIDPARGTDNTEGFRLVTLTDQVLYAVVWYRYNGQDIFARYGLSPQDGSILWQNRELISGRMPTVAAQIVNGVIYTTEYNLKPVASYIDSHGMTVNEIVQSRAAAYDATTGKMRWQTPEMVGEEPNGSFSLAVSGDVFSFQTYNQDWPATAQHPNSITTLHVLSTIDGAPRWHYQWKDGGMTGAALEGHSLYFEISQVKTAGTKQDLQVNVVALNAQTGDVRWSTPVKLLDGTEKTPTPVPHSTEPDFASGSAIDMAPVASNDAVYYSTPGNRVYTLQPSDGKILAQFSVEKTPQTIVDDRVVLFVVS
jgi:outer membrane protein assembly factor BamB